VVWEAEMRPMWTQDRPRPQSPDLRAAEAWIDAHIADPTLALTMGDWDAVLAGAHVRGAGGVETIIKGMKKRQTAQRLRGQELEKLAKTAGLSGQERRALELAERFQRPDGRPEIAEVARHMEKRDGGPISQATAAVYLERAQKKILKRLSGEENGGKTCD